MRIILLTILGQPNEGGVGDGPEANPLESETATELFRSLSAVGEKVLLPFAINLLVALIIFVIGRWVAGLLTRFVERSLTKANVDETLVKFLGNIVNALLLVLVCVAALRKLGIDTTSFAAVLAAAGLAVGLALHGSLSNFASGVMLVLFKPFKVGDFVDAGGSAGVVEEIRLFSTAMRTGDNVQIIVPNSSITNATITNYSAKETRRIDLVIGCGYDDNLRDVKELLVSLVEGDERILKEPEAVVAVNELGESSVDFVVRPWVNSADYWSVRWDLIEAIKNQFDDRGFNIPYPTRDIHVTNTAND